MPHVLSTAGKVISFLVLAFFGARLDFMSVASVPPRGPQTLVASFDVHVSSFAYRGLRSRRRGQAARRMVMRARDLFPVSAYVMAVVELQRIWRGILVRRRLVRKYVDRSFVPRSALHNQVAITAYHRCAKAPETAFFQLLQRVQQRWRAVLVREDFLRWSAMDRWAVYFVAAATVQRAWLDYRFRAKRKRHRRRGQMRYASRPDTMAARIQWAWRAWVHRQVFAYLRSLIALYDAADPMLAMRAVCPSESYLADPAAGLHVRFRLNGLSFPPSLVFRVATHRPVCDIGSFAPKDYTLCRRNPTTRGVHNHPPKLAPLALSAAHSVGEQRDRIAAQFASMQKDRAYWYHRVENNDWRTVPSSIILAPAASLVTPSSSAKAPMVAAHPAAARYFFNPTVQPNDFVGSAMLKSARPRHWNRAVRRGERAAMAKQKKRQWLVELYASEQAAVRQTTRDAVMPLARSFFATLTDADIDEETDRLLQWSDALSFEAYQASWTATATTAGSEAFVPLPHRQGASTGRTESY